jgi:hypothetical protein
MRFCAECGLWLADLPEIVPRRSVPLRSVARTASFARGSAIEVVEDLRAHAASRFRIGVRGISPGRTSCSPARAGTLGAWLAVFLDDL